MRLNNLFDTSKMVLKFLCLRKKKTKKIKNSFILNHIFVDWSGKIKFLN